MASSQNRRTIALPIAMVLGGVFYEFFDKIGFLPPYLIFAMLFVTFTRVSPRDLRFGKLHWTLLAIQILGGVGIYLVFHLFHIFDEVVAQGLMMSVFAPTAMASVVIAGMLGANVTTMATFCLLSNVSVAFIAPVLFTAIGAHPGMEFWQSVGIIMTKVGPLLILPFLLAWGLEKIAPKWHKAVRERQQISFWLWALSLTIVMGRTVKFIIDQPRGNWFDMAILAAGSLLLCLGQFAAGRYFGGRSGDKVAGGQSLGQKNNVLAIWMSQTYLDPLSSIAPAMYVAWQNIVNSWQLWRYNRK